MLRRVCIVLVTAALLGSSIAIRRHTDPEHEVETLMDMAYLPNGRLLGWISGGMDDFFADILWIRCFKYVMDHFVSDRDYTYLFKAYDILTDFDPDFEKAYIYGSYFLSGIADEYRNARRLLEKGWEKKPSSWRIPFELGMLYYLHLKDDTHASIWFRRAALVPGAPKFVKEYAGNWLEDKGRLREALAVWRGILERASKESVRKVAEWNVKKYTSLIQKKKLKEAIERFREKNGRLPHSLDELGLPKEDLVDAFGERFLYVADASERPEGYILDCKELVRKTLDKRIAYMKNFLLPRFRERFGRWPKSIREMIEKGVIKRLPPLPYGIIPDCDPKTGKLSYDSDLDVYFDRMRVETARKRLPGTRRRGYNGIFSRQGGLSQGKE